MTMTVPATAAGVQGLEATIYALDVTGHISTHTVALNIASATEAPSESVSPVDIKIIKPANHSQLTWVIHSLIWMLTRLCQLINLL